VRLPELAGSTRESLPRGGGDRVTSCRCPACYRACRPSGQYQCTSGSCLRPQPGVAAVDQVCASRGPDCPGDQRGGSAPAAVLRAGAGADAAVRARAAAGPAGIHAGDRTGQGHHHGPVTLRARRHSTCCAGPPSAATCRSGTSPPRSWPRPRRSRPSGSGRSHAVTRSPETLRSPPTRTATVVLVFVVPDAAAGSSLVLRRLHGTGRALAESLGGPDRRQRPGGSPRGFWLLWR